MRHPSIECLLVAALMATPAAADADHRAGPEITRYCVTQIGDSTMRLNSIADMNQRGHVVGLVFVASGPKVFLWDRRRGFEAIEGLVPEHSSIIDLLGINDRDQIVGTRLIVTGGSIHRAFLWDRARGLRFLEPLPGDRHSGAFAINNKGQVIGTSGPLAGQRPEGGHAVIWDRRFEIRDIGDLLDGIGVNIPVDINDAGEVVGNSDTLAGTRAYIWDRNNGIRALGGLPEGDGSSTASAINDRREVVGTSAFVNSKHAFFWSEGSGVVDLGDLEGGAGLSSANSINNRRQIVGFSSAQEGGQAVVWDSHGEIHRLDDLIVRVGPDSQFLRLLFGQEINDAGWIAAYGYDARNFKVQYKFLLTPAPHIPRGSDRRPCEKR